MHLLAETSEEDNAKCLGIVPASAKKLPGSPQNPVPNMGWCPVQQVSAHAVLDGMQSGDYFYFVHSYALPLTAHTLATARHAAEFSAVIGKDNFVAAQFHPERSSAAGSHLLQRFLQWQP